MAYAQSQSSPLLSTTQPDQLRTTHTSSQDSITMRSFAIIATICAAIVGTTSALVDAGDRTWVDVDANGYDTRTSGSGCRPSGCVPSNTRDNDLWESSRWSCQGDILNSYAKDDGCCITYSFEEPQDIVWLCIAFHNGDENTRTLEVFNNGDKHSTITSSGSTLGYQYFPLYTDETKEIKLCLDDPKWNTDVWLSITEVRFLVN